MDNLPNDIQNQIYKNIHEINFNKTLRLIKRIKTDWHDEHYFFRAGNE